MLGRSRTNRFVCYFKGFPGGKVVKNLPADAGDTRDLGLTPGSGRSLKEGVAPLSSVLAWKSPQTEEPGGLLSIGSQRIRHDCHT